MCEAVGSLAPMSLDEVEASVALQTRVDRKYVVSTEHLDALAVSLTRDRYVVEISGARTFGYRSLYFDTPTRASFHSTATRRRRRFKVRTRLYESTNTAALELKIRGARGETVKLRQPHHADRLDWLDAGAVQFLDDESTRTQLSSAGGAGGLAPTVWTTYQRTTLVDPGAQARITIDLDLATAAYGDRIEPYGRFAIIETKTAGPACWADQVLWSTRNRPVSVSKFALASVRADNSLPSNRWHRLLRQYPAATDVGQGGVS
jgi:VTC domain